MKIVETPDNINLGQIKCLYCNKWVNPTLAQVSMRIGSIKGYSLGENRIYCNNNDECKMLCPTYKQVKYPKGFKTNTSREVNSELRKMCFERDNWTCIKCGNTNNLHCHHIEGYAHFPILANDLSNVITVCEYCHNVIHNTDGCRYYDYRC